MGWKASDIPDLSGRVAVVTGGNGGLGLETVHALAARGAAVVIGARNLEKAEAARRTVQSGAPGSSVEIARLDLASLASVESFAGEVTAAHPSIDLLFNNAGVMAVPEGRTKDGFETQFGSNHLGHFALTMRLLPRLIAAAARGREARVVSTTSTARFMAGSFDLSDLHLRRRYDPWRAYGISKRANLEFVLELDRRLAGRGVRGLAADPGLSKTDLQPASVRANSSFLSRFFDVTTKLAGQPARMGALPQLRAGTDPAASGGALFAPRWVSFGAPVVRGVSGGMADPAEHAALWELSERETGLSLASIGG
jgi:NAD(P)-dependent dehydrogenase (short-subunit alcohol dehydrogenase family)